MSEPARRMRGAGTEEAPAVLSFDVEEHHRIESARGVDVSTSLREHYSQRMEDATRWLLDELHAAGVRATFFILGQAARARPGLARAVHEAGHEVASHGWDHRRLHHLSPASLREDLRLGKDALEQATGASVRGYRAPTFSLVAQTAWAIDVLADLGFLYDSSIYPVRHDRYGIPTAPRGPFVLQGREREILEIPPATVRLGGLNLPIGGGGYFRLLPSTLMNQALDRSRRDPETGATMLYFHPWEFDPDQPRLPLKRLNKFRTYVGLKRTRTRLARLLPAFSFTRADALAARLHQRLDDLPRFRPLFNEPAPS